MVSSCKETRSIKCIFLSILRGINSPGGHQLIPQVFADHDLCLIRCSFVPDGGIVTAFASAHGAGAVDFAFCQTPVGASCPRPPVVMPANAIEQVFLSLDGSFSLAAVISAASFHDYHSLTDRPPAGGVRLIPYRQAICRVVIRIVKILICRTFMAP